MDKMEREEISVPSKEKNGLEVEDDNPGTFINEPLWRKFAFKFLAYLLYVIGQAIIVVPSIGWSNTVFLTGCTTIIMPLVWSTLDAQARNKEIQAKIKSDLLMAKEKSAWESEKEAMEAEIEIVKSELNTRCIELAANQIALDRVK